MYRAEGQGSMIANRENDMSDNDKAKIDDGGSAFPAGIQIRDPVTLEWGMSLRDWFAGHETLAEWDYPDSVVRAGMCDALAGRPRPKNGWNAKAKDEWLDMLKWDAAWRAAIKYIRSDAMLAERAKEAGK